MWPHTKLTEKLGIQLPIIQAPIAGGATTPELVAAVSNAGGLGSLGAAYMQPDDIRSAIKKIRELTQKPFVVNLFIPEKFQENAQQTKMMCEIVEKACAELNIKINAPKPPYAPSFDEQFKILIAEKVPIFSFTLGIPGDEQINELQKNNILTIGTATTLKEAQLLQDKGIDIIAAQGSEAGGHRGSFLAPVADSLIGLFALLPQLVDHLNIPIVAAGGIMDARGIVAALTLGAAGVQMGTAFLSCPEAGTHPKYKELLLNIKEDHTVLTRAFSGKYARGIKNKFTERMTLNNTDILDFPIQNAFTRPMRKEAEKQNNIDFMSLWAGQAAYLSKGLPAADLIKILNNEVIACWNKFSTFPSSERY